MDTILFADFLQIIAPHEQPLAKQIDDLLTEGGCSRVLKEAASGITVSYITGTTKKTIANFVCRKAGIKIRITPQKPFECAEILQDLPDNMKKDIIKANVCKRLSDATLCNPRCPMGYDFVLDGQHYQKCRSLAFLFEVTQENLPYLCNFVKAAVR